MYSEVLIVQKQIQLSAHPHINHFEAVQCIEPQNDVKGTDNTFLHGTLLSMMYLMPI